MLTKCHAQFYPLYKHPLIQSSKYPCRVGSVIISILEIGKLRLAAQRACVRPASPVAVPGVKLRRLGQSLCFSLPTHADFLNERLLFIKQFLCVSTKQRSCHSWSYLILTKRDYHPHFIGVEAEVNQISMTQPSNHRWLGSEQCLFLWGPHFLTTQRSIW